MFVSYAQNLEDVVLWRALKDVRCGFYVDIGANDPDAHSVSKAFFENGWRGISVEPEPVYAERLRSKRPSEHVVEAAAGAATDNACFFSIEGTGLSTLDQAVALAHAASHTVSMRAVKVVTLDEILSLAEEDIHWLKIDVEGHEESVLRSWQSSAKRPWIVVVEAVDPVTKRKVSTDAAAILQSKGYALVYFDGLNDFYLHDSHSQLASHFGVPPNVFDNFVFAAESDFCFLAIAERRSQVSEMQARLTEMEHKAALLAEQLQAETGRAAVIEAKCIELQGERDRLLNEQENLAGEFTGLRQQAAADKEGSLVRERGLTAEVDRYKNALDAQTRAAQSANARYDAALSELASIRNSTSWRITAPLREVVIFARRAKRTLRGGSVKTVGQIINRVRVSGRDRSRLPTALRLERREQSAAPPPFSSLSTTEPTEGAAPAAALLRERMRLWAHGARIDAR